jgi:hypothetical protein
MPSMDNTTSPDDFEDTKIAIIKVLSAIEHLPKDCRFDVLLNSLVLNYVIGGYEINEKDFISTITMQLKTTLRFHLKKISEIDPTK